MSTIVTMYDCAFGDCFKISTQNNANKSVRHLYVDFGIHHRCMNQTQRQQRYQQIINRMPRTNVDFLLTHYHYDHYDGALYMGEQGVRRFDNIYIPDVWGLDTSVYTVEHLLLYDLCRTSVLSHGRSLISFLLSICRGNGRIHFVRRGSEIQESYIALWPSMDVVNHAAESLRNHMVHNEAVDIPQELSEVAERLRMIMQNLTQYENIDAQAQYLAQLEELERQMSRLARQIRVAKPVQQKLAAFAHSINIIFQNNDQTDRNILFTGDADGGTTRSGADLWSFLEDNADLAIPLHEHYDVIKLPHHGTPAHYHDFTARATDHTIFLIPNGRIPQWNIDERYSNNANHHRSFVCCSRNDACPVSAPVCNCNRCLVIDQIPALWIDV